MPNEIEAAAVSGPFRRLHHVCVVVPDIDAAVRYYQSIGIGPWYDYPTSSPYVEFEVPNPAAARNAREMCADLDGIQMQLCQPSSDDSPQRRFLDECGAGVYHLGFEVADCDTGEAAGRAVGLEVLARGRREDGSGFTYFDTRADAGVTLEIRHSAGH